MTEIAEPCAEEVVPSRALSIKMLLSDLIDLTCGCRETRWPRWP